VFAVIAAYLESKKVVALQRREMIDDFDVVEIVDCGEVVQVIDCEFAL
jgi:hypothetical protein